MNNGYKRMDNWDDLEYVRLNILLTNRCNQRCISCNSYNSFIGQRELTKEKIYQTAKEICSKFDIRNIAFVGGEPTFRQDYLEIIEMTKRLAPNHSITSNGYGMQTDECVEKILDAGINRFTYSYHGIGKHDAFTRIKGSEEKVRNAIKLTIKHKRDDTFIKVGSLFNGYNASDISKMAEWCEFIGVQLYVELLDLTIPWIGDNSILSKKNKKDEAILDENIEQLQYIIDTSSAIVLSEESKKFISAYFKGVNMKGRCPLYKTDIYIMPNGDVMTGCYDLPPVGNVNENNIMSILGSEQAKSNYEKMNKRECPGCTCGYQAQANYITF